jgi:hypothetical protein
MPSTTAPNQELRDEDWNCYDSGRADIHYDKCAATVYSSHVWKFPNISHTNRSANRSE